MYYPPSCNPPILIEPDGTEDKQESHLDEVFHALTSSAAPGHDRPSVRHFVCRNVVITLIDASTVLSRDLLTVQNSQYRKYRVPVPYRRWHAEKLFDLAKIADCLHVAAVHSKHELALLSHHPHQPLRT